jgi:P-type conjugative transfer protein TrbJ
MVLRPFFEKGKAMKKILMLAVLLVMVACSKGHAMAVFDGSNLAQNIISARESVAQTMNQVQQLQNQLLQYQRMLQDAMNPGDFAWGDIQGTIDQIKNTMNSLNNLGGMGGGGGMDSYLDSFGSYDKYQTGSYYGSDNPTALYSGDLAGSQLQKDSADDLLKLVKEQQEALDAYSDELETLKSKAAGAQGQQEAIQATNEFASMEIQLLSQIHALLLAQNTMMAAEVETQNNREAQQRMGTAIKMGETDFSRRETTQGGKSYKQF